MVDTYTINGIDSLLDNISEDEYQDTLEALLDNIEIRLEEWREEHPYEG